MLSIRKLLNKPKPNDTRPLAVFYYCDEAVTQQMEALNHLMRSTPDNLGRRSALIRQLKEAQHNLMTVIMGIVEEAIGARQRAPRDFRVKYPDDVLVDQISGPIWFGAECIAAGSHIANHEAESSELRPHATQLSKSIAKVRNALREQCFISRGSSYPQKLRELLQWFDAQWAEFEFRYVSLMCSVKSEEQYHQQQDVVILFCESTLRAVRKDYISNDMLEMMDPAVMFAIPRLAIVCGLVIYPEGPLDTSKGHKEMPSFFRGYRQLLIRIKELLGYLTKEQLTALEQALCSAEGLGTLNRKKLQRASNSPRQVPRRRLSEPSEPTAATAAPSHLHPETPTNSSIQRRSYNPDSQDDSATAFEPDSVTEVRPVETTEEPQFPNLGVDHPIVNDLSSGGGRSRSETHSSAASTSATAATASCELTNIPSNSIEPKHNLPSVTPLATTAATAMAASSPASEPQSRRSKCPKKTGRRNKGPAGFASAEDLMHRLFVAISGVADQLQTNHAKDIRVILKHVFTICQSEPEPLRLSEGDKCHSEPCTPEPQSPLVASSIAQRFSFSTSSLSFGDRPSWVPDSDCPTCSACQENFSWRRRRHHCRNCGHVVCARCSPNIVSLPQIGIVKAARVCTHCYLQYLGQAARMTLDLTQSVQVH